MYGGLVATHQRSFGR